MSAWQSCSWPTDCKMIVKIDTSQSEMHSIINAASKLSIHSSNEMLIHLSLQKFMIINNIIRGKKQLCVDILTLLLARVQPNVVLREYAAVCEVPIGADRMVWKYGPLPVLLFLFSAKWRGTFNS